MTSEHAHPNTCIKYGGFHPLFLQVDFVGARHCEARAYNMLKDITDDSSFAPKYLSYAQGFNLTNRMPLFVHAPPASVGVNDTMWLMRTHFEGALIVHMDTHTHHEDKHAHRYTHARNVVRRTV